MSAASRIDWRRCVVQSLIISILQGVVLQPGYLVWAESVRYGAATFLALLMPHFAIAMLLAASAQYVEGRWPAPAIVALGAAGCVLIILQLWANDILRGLLDLSGGVQVSVWWIAWLAVASGAPFFWYCLMVQRSVRVSSLLARAELERARTAVLIGQAQAEALEGRVEPALLQRALQALQVAYARNRVQAETLLEALVGFLRQAMPAIRSGHSTLMDELTLLRRYAELIHLVDGGRRLCSIEIDAPPRDPAFAPLLLIPLVEALAEANGESVPPHVALNVESSALRLTLDASAAPDAWMNDAQARRLDRALRTLPDPAGVRYEVGGSHAFTLWLPLPPTPEEQRIEERLQAA